MTRTVWKAVATTVVLVVAPFAWIPLAATKASTLILLQLPLLATLYLFTVVVGVISIAGAPFLRHGWLRIPLVVIFMVGFAADYAARAIQGVPLSSHMLATFIQAREELGHAVGTYSLDLAVALLVGVLLTPPLAMAPQPRISLGSWFAGIVALAVALSALLVGSLGHVEELPAPIGVPVQAFFAARESAATYLGPRDPLVYLGKTTRKIEKILLIVDESIRGDYLQLNNSRFDNTPFLVSASPTLANFGVATSYSNCSNTARVALRSGARDSDFPDPGGRVLHQPTFWQFARNAGYRTIHIDTWLPVRRMSSMLTYDELSYVDERFRVPLDPYWQADDRVADRIIEEVGRPGPLLMFVEKIGMHTPYQRNLPPASEYVPGPGSVPNRNLDLARAENVKRYSIGIWRRVDKFFEQLLPAIDRPGVLLIYTSDHGQALYDGGYDASNCSGPNAVVGEGLVPLLVFAGDESTRRLFQAAAERSFNRAAHSDIFPTLLWAMGFDVSLVKPQYPVGLLALPNERKRRFFVFSPFGKDIQWVAVD